MNSAVLLFVGAVVLPIAVIDVRRKWRDWRRSAGAWNSIGASDGGIGHTSGPSQ